MISNHLLNQKADKDYENIVVMVIKIRLTLWYSIAMVIRTLQFVLTILDDIGSRVKGAVKWWNTQAGILCIEEEKQYTKCYTR